MRNRFLAVLAVIPLAFAADKYEVNWTQQRSEIFEHYSSLIRIDTSSPPGSLRETPLQRFHSIINVRAAWFAISRRIALQSHPTRVIDVVTR